MQVFSAINVKPQATSAVKFGLQQTTEAHKLRQEIARLFKEGNADHVLVYTLPPSLSSQPVLLATRKDAITLLREAEARGPERFKLAVKQGLPSEALNGADDIEGMIRLFEREIKNNPVNP